MKLSFVGGNPEGGDFELIPENVPMQVTFMTVEDSDFAKDRPKFVWRIDEYDEDDMAEAGVDFDFRGENYWEYIKIPNKKLNGKMRLHAVISMLIGHTLKEDEPVELEDYYGSKYIAKFKHVPKQKANGDGSFGIVKNEQGGTVYKHQLTDLTAMKKKRKAAPVQESFNEDDFETE